MKVFRLDDLTNKKLMAKNGSTLSEKKTGGGCAKAILSREEKTHEKNI